MRSAFLLLAAAYSFSCAPTVVVQPAPPSVVKVVGAPCPTPASTSASVSALVSEAAPVSESASDSASEPASVSEPASTPAEPGVGERVVAFRVFPNHASLRVAGRVVKSGDQLALPVGHHTVVAKDRCCKRLLRKLTVVAAPESEPERIQVASVALELEPAIVSLVGAPAGGSMACPGLGVVVANGASAPVSLETTTQVVHCRFQPTGHALSVTMTAGVRTSVSWPTR